MATPINAAILPDIGLMRWLVGILALVGAFGGMAAAEDVPLPRPRPHIELWPEPRSFREAAGPNFNSVEVTAEPSDCRQRLETIAAIRAMPRLIGPGECGGVDMVELNAARLTNGSSVTFNPKPLVRCEMAESLASWVRDEAAPRLAKAGNVLRQVETYDDFECRGRNRVNGAKLSEHGKGNAVDVRAFTLADKHVLVLTDMTVPKDIRTELRDSACARFTTVLGPGSDGHHDSHIHLDLIQRRNGFRMCQWEVREPVVAEIVPLPPPRPKIADAPVKDGRKL